MENTPSRNRIDLAYVRSLAVQIHQRHPFFYLVVITAIGAPVLFFNWSWLTAIGISSLLLSFLPCAVMCAVGLCMRSGKNCSKNSATINDDENR